MKVFSPMVLIMLHMLNKPLFWVVTCESRAVSSRPAGLGADVVQHALAAPRGQLALLEGLGQARAGA